MSKIDTKVASMNKTVGFGKIDSMNKIVGAKKKWTRSSL